MNKKYNSPTIKDVAREAEVSLKTVSRILNNSSEVKLETRERVLKIIADIGYSPNTVARSLRIKKTYSIGMIIPDITNSFYSNIVRGIEDVALRNNYSVLLANSDEMQSKEDLNIKVFIEKQVEGIVLFPSSGSKEYLKSIVKNIPIVFVDRDIKELNVSSVTVENEKAMYDLTKHLLVEHGYQKIAYISHTMDVTASDKRYKGFRNALNDAGIHLISEMIRLNNRTIQDAYESIIKMFKEGNRPQAIITSNNIMALGVMKALRYFSLEVPRDIALATFDDFEMSEIFRPHLTVISQPAYEIGKNAAEILFKQMKDRSVLEKLILPTQLIFRESCGCTMFNK